MKGRNSITGSVPHKWDLTRRVMVISFVCVIIVLIGFILFQISKSRTFQFFGGLTYRVETGEKVVALTLDDAPTARTQEVLDILADKHIKATFYEIGSAMEKYPGMARAIVDAGMEVGNHSYSHTRMVLKTQNFIDTEIQKTNELIRKSGYTGDTTFRPPNGKKLFGLPWYLSRHGIPTIMWDVEPDTYVGGDADAIVRYTLEHTRAGSIILMHPFCEEDCKADRDALPRIIDELHARGYTFVTVSNLLKLGK